MENIYVRLIDLPATIKAYVVANADQSYTIVLNSTLNHEQNMKSYAHEMKHILGDDFTKEDINKIELQAHSA